MQVILLEKISKNNNLGEVVKVKAGFARNFLFPNNKAKPATEKNLAEFKKIKAELEAKEQEKLIAATAIKEQLDDITLSIEANASEDGKLFGSISTADIATALAEQKFQIAKKDIDLIEMIHNIGEYKININLYDNVVAIININVINAKNQ